MIYIIPLIEAYNIIGSLEQRIDFNIMQINELKQAGGDPIIIRELKSNNETILDAVRFIASCVKGSTSALLNDLDGLEEYLKYDVQLMDLEVDNATDKSNEQEPESG